MPPLIEEDEHLHSTSPFVPRRRLTRKQAPPDQRASGGGGAYDVLGMALAAECDPLLEDARRQHIHWTHSRTKNAEDKKPEEFTREAFWNHLVKVYQEVYPDDTSPTKSIL